MRAKAALFPIDLSRRPSRWAGIVMAELYADQERWPLWLPVLFGVGVAAYFALPFEPSPALGQLLALLASAGAVVGGVLRHRFEGWLVLMLAASIGGFAAGSLRTAAVDAPAVPYSGTYTVEGRVVDLEPRRKGARVVLTDLRIERTAPEATPERVRVTLRGVPDGLAVGARIRLKGRLSPPSGPLYPNGYDFARKAFFQGLGGIGFAYGYADVVGQAPVGASDRVAQLRHDIAAAIEAAIPGDEGAVAVALVTGLRADIPDKVWADMQGAGLAHLLAISGLHMTLIAGTVFIALRYLFALIPPLVVRVPAKKPAAIVAILAAAFYLLISGATPPTQRAFVMTAIGLTAIVLDRSPLSMRLVAVAAAVVLLLRPESVVGASFQMSFAAVVALIAWYERRPGERDGARERQVHPILIYIGGVAVTTLIASLATAPFGAWHFGRVVVFGVIANLIGVPLTAFCIMPAALCALVLLPFGLAGPFFWLMGYGIAWLLWTADLFAGLPFAAFEVAPPPAYAFLLFLAGGLWLCLWRRPWRRAGLVPMALGLLLMPLGERPLLLASGDARHVAFLGDDGKARFLDLERDKFIKKMWLQALGGVEAPLPDVSTKNPVAGLRCDSIGCVWHVEGRRLAVANHPRAAAEDCGRVDLLLNLDGSAPCAGPALDRKALVASGGIGVYADFEVRTVREGRGERPWVR